MVCLCVKAGGQGESLEVKHRSLIMMMRLDVARQTVSFCLTKISHLHTHTHTFNQAQYTHSHSAGSKHRATASSLFGYYSLFRVLGYRSNWSLWPPANPWGCSGNLSPCVYTGDDSSPQSGALDNFSRRLYNFYCSVSPKNVGLLPPVGASDVLHSREVFLFVRKGE